MATKWQHAGAEPTGPSGTRYYRKPLVSGQVAERIELALSRTANKEFTLLRTLASEPSRVFTKAELLRDVWGFRSLGTTRRYRIPPFGGAIA